MSLGDSKTSQTIAGGLAAKPSYLLVFGLVFIFGTGSAAGIFSGYRTSSGLVLILSSIVFVVTLISCVLLVRSVLEVDPAALAVAGDLAPAIEEAAKIEGSHEIQSSFSRDLDVAFRKSSDCLLFGVHHSHILNRYYPVIQEKLKLGDRFKILVIDPGDDASVRMTSMRFPGNIDASQERSRILSSLASWSELRAEYSELIEIRTLNFLMAYGGFLFDWRGEDVSIFVQQYTFKVHGGAVKPKFEHHGRENPWLALRSAEVLAMWDCGQVYPEVRTGVSGQNEL